LDNAASPQQVRPLLPGSAGCAVVVASRSRLSGLVARDGATRITLAPLPDVEAVALLRDALALRRQAGDRMGEADTLSRLAGALHDKGEASAARESWRLALLIFDELGAPQADEIRIRLTAAAD
jgi:hypothetical protein